MSFHNSYRSPETKHEVTQAAGILTGLGIIFALVTLFGVGMAWAYHDAKHFVIAVPCAFASLLTFAAGAS